MKLLGIDILISRKCPGLLMVDRTGVVFFQSGQVVRVERTPEVEEILREIERSSRSNV
jgi:hypothetical protein